jgi:acyl-homoserine lactone acylase PvdQ
MRYLFLLLLLPVVTNAQPFSAAEIKKWQQQANNITIIRDNWGVPHVYGKTDADAVFGLLYAQCEDDFKRVEMNYIEKLGRKAEVIGQEELYNDLYIRLVLDSAEAMADFKKAPVWLKELLQAYADGINFYLYKHPEVKPALLTRFKPWYPLLWTDGSIGAISTGDITAADVRNLYGNEDKPVVLGPKKFTENSNGSNGFAIAPSKTESGKSILYINPHVTFYFRPEVHMVSEQGLNAYGAVTWGQFFVYQGFNEYCGWMHTSANVDVADMYTEKISGTIGKMTYWYNNEQRRVKEKIITIKVKNGIEVMDKTFVTLATHHGPVMAKRDGQYISVRSSNRMMNGLLQSWLRTKTKGLDDYKKVMALRGNTSNSTVFADKHGNIAYWHGNYIPKRDPKFNWGKAVDGTTAATEWLGLHEAEEIVHVYNPVSGWIQNCNSTPYTVSGDASPKKTDYPAYMAPDGENFRGINAAKVLQKENKFTIDKTITAGYDMYLSAFEVLLPALIQSFEKTIKPTDSLYHSLAAPIAVLKNWNYYADNHSIATTIAVEWAERLNSSIRKIYIEDGDDDQVTATKRFAATATSDQLLLPLEQTIKHLKKQFGTWEIQWGDINRYQRISNDLIQKYDDAKLSYPVPFASALWGMLPSYNSRIFPGTKKRYGISGNSFVCAVEFGEKVKAKSLLAGGNSGHVNSIHFSDQLEMYTQGKFKDVLFYKEDVLKHVERSYRPGN